MDKEFQFLMYQSAEEDVSVNAVVKDETIWLTQKAMAELFGVQTPAISKHLKNIFEEGELDEKVVVSKMEITTQLADMTSCQIRAPSPDKRQSQKRKPNTRSSTKHSASPRILTVRSRKYWSKEIMEMTADPLTEEAVDHRAEW